MGRIHLLYSGSLASQWNKLWSLGNILVEIQLSFHAGTDFDLMVHANHDSEVVLVHIKIPEWSLYYISGRQHNSKENSMGYTTGDSLI